MQPARKAVLRGSTNKREEAKGASDADIPSESQGTEMIVPGAAPLVGNGIDNCCIFWFPVEIGCRMWYNSEKRVALDRRSHPCRSE